MTALEKAQAEATKAKRAAARAVEAAETAAAVEAEKLEDAKRKEAEAARGIIFDRFLTNVKAALAAQSKTPYEITGAGNHFGVREGAGVSTPVTLIEEHCSYSIGHRGNGKWRASVGQYGNRKQWPQRKDGSHNYAAIAEFILDDLERQSSFNARWDNKQANRDTVKNIAQNFDLDESSRVSLEPTSDPASPVRVSVRFNSDCTEAGARKLLQTLEAAGVTFG